MNRTLAMFGASIICPFATLWAKRESRRIYRFGTPLDPFGLQIAQQLGIKNPEKVRLLHLPSIPMISSPTVRFLSKSLKLINPFTIGMALSYGILIREDYRGDMSLLAHELVHVRQYERFGSISKFMRQYLFELFYQGYMNAPLEIEAQAGAKSYGLRRFNSTE